MAKTSLYPSSPPEVPDDLTEPTSQYKTQALLVLFALALFFLLYFGLMFFCLAFGIWAVLICPFLNLAPLLKILAFFFVIPAGVLFVYLVKNLFRFERAQKEFRIEIFEEEHPRLFEFIASVCEETGAHFPKHVYVDYLVNAAAILETSSFFHMIMPTGRSLLIGLGLVNTINLTEFKALLAHEFGHFSQKSMKIGTYVYTVRGIVAQVVYGDDWFDRFIYDWSQMDARVAWPAHICRGVTWVLSKIIYLMWYVVVFFDLALSRQMEFSADLIAVALTGSDAPVHLLHRSYIGQASFNQGVDDLRVAMSHHLYTSDLFHHQAAAIGFIRKKNKEKDIRLEEPPTLPRNSEETTQVFEDEDDKVAEMWSTHPSCHDREQNAKAHYIRTRFDLRSPWLLFDNVEDLRERVTYKFYRFFFKIPKDVILAEPVEIQSFIDEEHGDRSYDPRYQGLYDNRNLVLKDIKVMCQEGSKAPWSITGLGNAHATLYNAEVKHRSQLYYKRIEESNLLTAVHNGWHKPRDNELEFRGDTYELEDAKRLLKIVDMELDKDQTWLAAIDRQVFMTYFQMGLHIDKEVAEELYRRYDFHLELQKIWFELQKQNRPVQAALAFLNSLNSGPMDTGAFHELLTIFRDAHKAMKIMLRTSEDMTLPALKNLPVGQPLRPFLLEKNLVDGLSKHERTITEKWIIRLLDQFNEMRMKVDRTHYKSLAGVLALQEKIGAECVRRWASLPTVKAVAK